MLRHLPAEAIAVLSFFVAVFCFGDVRAQLKFTDITDSAGVQHKFVVYEGMFGGGACVIDINQDGYEDLFVTGGMSDDVLYLNKGNGKFTNIYDQSGLTSTRNYVTQGVASADVNKDGWPDLFVTTITVKDTVRIIPRAKNLLFLNNGDMTFRDVTDEYGLKDLLSFSTGACFGDFNLDGYSDLYIGNYFVGYQGTLREINDATIVDATQTAEGYLLLNDRGKRFVNVYREYGMNHKGFGFGGVFTDFDNDHDLDLQLNHDFGYKATPSVLLVNEYPREKFVEQGKSLDMNLKINAMGTAVGDYNNDGWLDYYITNIRFNRFMVSQGPGKPFIDKAKESGMDFVSISWGANFADFDHDLDLDLFVANGDLNPNDVPLADFYFENDNGKFKDNSPSVGLNDYGIGRGSVVFDMDNDGDLDLLVVNQQPVLDYPVKSFTRLYRNDGVSRNWLKVKLQGANADMQGIGSRIRAVVNGKSFIREVDGGSGHLSQSSVIAHFGLGEADKVDSLVVTWVGGKQQVLTSLQANSLVVVKEIPDPPRSATSRYAVVGGGIVASLALLFLFRKYFS